MIAARETKIRSLFEEALGLSPSERTALLGRVRVAEPDIAEEVSSLLSFHDSRVGVLDDSAGLAAAVLGGSDAEGGGRGTSTAIDHESLATPTQIGRYRIIREVAQGGMGIVFEAQQDFPQRTVALKLVRPEYSSKTLLARFRQEAQALARLQHPAIAQIYEAGTAIVHGLERPYIAMEFVEGKPIREHVRSAHPTTNQVLDLMARVADAVDHAHTRGVVHRDLKPANILITTAPSPTSGAGGGKGGGNLAGLSQAQPKVLDFGIARLTEGDTGLTLEQTQQTQAGQVIGTLGYMSPEQITARQGEVDPRSDVYALGAVLYELLAGKPPFALEQCNFLQAIDIVRSSEPPALGRVDPAFRGDVEAIVAKAMEKEQSARYQSAAAFAEDLRRALRDEPVTAHPQTAWYQVRKFARRQRLLVSAVAGVMLALAAMLVYSQSQTRRAERATQAETTAKQQVAEQLSEVQRLQVAESSAKQSAQQEAKNAKAVRDYLVRLLTMARPEEQAGKETTMREALALASQELQGKFENDPTTQLELKTIIASGFAALGDHAQSAAGYQAAMELAQRTRPSDPTAGANEAALLAAEYDELDRNQEAVNLLEPILPKVVASRGENDLLTAMVKLYLGVGYKGVQDFDKAEPLIRDALRVREEKLGPDDSDTLNALNMLVLTLRDQSRHAECEPLARRNLASLMKTAGPEHPDTIAARANLAETLNNIGMAKEGMALLDEAYPLAQKILGKNHPDTLAVAMSIGTTAFEMGQFDKAIAVYEPTLEAMRTTMGAEHIKTLGVMNNLALCYERSGKLDAAATMLGQLIEVMVLKEPTSIRTALSLSNAARLQRTMGNLDRAMELSTQAITLAEKIMEPTHVARCRMQVGHALTLIQLHRFDEAEQYAGAAMQVLEVSQDIPPNMAKVLIRQLGDAYAKAGQGERSARWLAKLPTP
jgi:eukaryotic-like serine/threonine-protein kinase